jgi:hypothetical protein
MATRDVTTAASLFNFDSSFAFHQSCHAIDANHFINFWGGLDWDGYVQVFAVNTTTRAVTTAAAALEFDTDIGSHSCCIIVDTNHFINFWQWTSGDWFVQSFTVNTTTRAVTTAATRLEFDTADYQLGSVAVVDSNHFVLFWWGSGSDWFVQSFTVNTTTRAVTTAATRLEFDTQIWTNNSCFRIDTNHYINFWRWWTLNAIAQVFAVNTTTFAVSTSWAVFDMWLDNLGCTCQQVDANHFIVFYNSASLWNELAQVVTVDTSTWAITTSAASLIISTWGSSLTSRKIDDNHFILFYGWPWNDWFVGIFEVDTTTFEVTTASSLLEFDTQLGLSNSCFTVDSSHFINFWRDTNSDWIVQVFEVELPVVGWNSYTPRMMMWLWT